MRREQYFNFNTKTFYLFLCTQGAVESVHATMEYYFDSAFYPPAFWFSSNKCSTIIDIFRQICGSRLAQRSVAACAALHSACELSWWRCHNDSTI